MEQRAKTMEKDKMEKGKMEMPKTGDLSPGLLLLHAATLLAGISLSVEEASVTVTCI
jgi:hypothetical protein